MKSGPTSPRYAGLKPASSRATAAARGASCKRDTKPEVALRRAVWMRGLRYRTNVAALPGHPDLVFSAPRVVVFCDGDFWHGRNLTARLRKLERGHNAPYWVAKIAGNVARDRRNAARLAGAGWLVLRYWETDIDRNVERVADQILETIRRRRTPVTTT